MGRDSKIVRFVKKMHIEGKKKTKKKVIGCEYEEGWCEVDVGNLIKWKSR